jgi:putative sigma-54 modulation protein
MEIDISGRHFKVTAPLKDYIEKKVEKLDKFSLKIESVHVILEVQKFHHIAELTLLGKNLRVACKEESADMYGAFDNCLNDIQRKLARQHDRVKEHKGGRRFGVKAKAKAEKETDDEG